MTEKLPNKLSKRPPKKIDQVNTDDITSSKDISIIAGSENEVVSKTMRIYESDFKAIKEIAYREDKKMVEVVKDAVSMLYASKNYDK